MPGSWKSGTGTFSWRASLCASRMVASTLPASRSSGTARGRSSRWMARPERHVRAERDLEEGVVVAKLSADADRKLGEPVGVENQRAGHGAAIARAPESLARDVNQQPGPQEIDRMRYPIRDSATAHELDLRAEVGDGAAGAEPEPSAGPDAERGMQAQRRGVARGYAAGPTRPVTQLAGEKERGFRAQRRGTRRGATGGCLRHAHGGGPPQPEHCRHEPRERGQRLTMARALYPKSAASGAPNSTHARLVLRRFRPGSGSSVGPH